MSEKNRETLRDLMSQEMGGMWDVRLADLAKALAPHVSAEIRLLLNRAESLHRAVGLGNFMEDAENASCGEPVHGPEPDAAPEQERKPLPPEEWQVGDRLLRTSHGDYRRLLMCGQNPALGIWCFVCGETGGWLETVLSSDLVFHSRPPLEPGQVVRNLVTGQTFEIAKREDDRDIGDEAYLMVGGNWTRRTALVPLTLPLSLLEEKNP